VKYDAQASVQVNNSGVIPISDTVPGALQGLPGQYYGGVGGGFTTLTFIFNLPAGAVVTGNNTATFYFNGTDGASSGYRVLGLNIIAGGSQLIPQSSFTWDDPNAWQPPLNDAADIAAGQALYKSAGLTAPGVGPIQAHCGDCHTQDGRDLKYFNFTNNSIIVRSQFHGLTAQQGAQIASYIRSLNQPNPGRPWNPPYQPGPGLDSQPVQNWAAGAGLSSVLNNDSDMAAYLAPGGSTANWAPGGSINPREIPVAFQLPDWNSWLPKTHPKDGFGATFTSSACAADYPKLVAALQPNSASAYQGAIGALDFDNFTDDCDWTFLLPYITPANNNNAWTPALRTSTYSMVQWVLVKLWEINQQNGLEAMPQVAFGSKADLRSWYSIQPFNTSPSMRAIPFGPGLGNGSNESATYLSQGWYLLQLILNAGQGKQTDHDPIDYIYAEARVKDLSNSANNAPEAMLEFEWIIKLLQEQHLNGLGPDVQSMYGGFQPAGITPEFIVSDPTMCTGISPSALATYLGAFTQSWFAMDSSFTPAQYYAIGWASPTENPQASERNNSFGSMAGQLWGFLPRLRYLGVDPNVTYQFANWAATVWPAGNWALNNAATCVDLGHCTSD
jgi:hypothetical protein